MTTLSLPQVGVTPDPTWATMLNQAFTDLNSGKAESVHTHSASDVTSGTFSAARLGTGTADTTTYLRGDGTWQTVAATPSDATTSSKGIVQLAGDLAGTATVPKVNKIAGATISATPGTPDNTVALYGDGVWRAPATAAQGALAATAVQPAALASYVPTTRTVAGKALSANITLAKADVGLPNVDNTADVNKPISTLTQTALDGKAALSHTHPSSQISDSTALGRSMILAGDIPTARAVLGIYVGSTDPGGPDGTIWLRTP